MPNFDKKLSSIKLKEKKEEIETYEANMKILIKKIKIKNDNDFFYRTMLCNKEGIFKIINNNDYIYIYYDININIDELLSLNDIKEVTPEGYCEPLNKTEIEELLSKENAMCKIKFKRIVNHKLENCTGSGFFLQFKYKEIPFKKCLITNNHVINEAGADDEIRLEYQNHGKVIEITKNGKERKVFSDKILDYILIELFDDDDFNYFKIDQDIIKNESTVFDNHDIFILQYPNGNELSFSLGKVLSINDKKLRHNCPTAFGSSGSPVISRSSNASIIGLHFGADINSKFNLSTPILSILDDINEKIKAKKDNINNNNSINYIIAEIEIKNEHINQDIRIINSFEQIVKEAKCFLYQIEYYKYENLKEIKESIEISINGHVIPFNYFYNFKEEGRYTIRYSFKKPLTKTNHLFSQCDLFTYLNLYNFDTSNVTNMESMFWGCESLTDINLSKSITKNVKNFSYMFFRCKSLKNLDLSSFNTQNSLTMNCMFGFCSSLKKLNLSNFKIQKTSDVDQMFVDCKELKIQNLICCNEKILNELKKYKNK
jgi:surface protein